MIQDSILEHFSILVAQNLMYTVKIINTKQRPFCFVLNDFNLRDFNEVWYSVIEMNLNKAVLSQIV